MITDQLLRLSSAQSLIIASGAEAESTNVIDLSVARDVGQGHPLYVVVSFSSNLAGAAGALITVQVETHTAEDFTAARTVRVATRALPVADIDGKAVAIPLPPNIGDAFVDHRYMAIRYVVSGANVTAGTANADIVLDIQDGEKFYASGFTVA